MGLHNLEKIFKPRSVAIIGASQKTGTIGWAILKNMKEAHFDGAIFPVNPSYSEIQGIKAYAAISEIGQPVDLAVIAIPIDGVPSIVKECVDVRARGAVIISAGGKETGLQGVEIEKKVWQEARRGGLRILGPNCVGIICPDQHLNTTFIAHMPRPGKLAFISQSGAICAAMLDLSLKEEVGFSHFVSIGSMLDVDFGDLIDYLGNDENVKSILLYIESLSNFRKFMSAARAASRVKPIIALKAGKSAAGAKAAASHTGAMAGEDSVYDAAFRRAGIVRVNTIEDFFDCAELVDKQPRPSGKRMVVITNSGGPGVMAADAIASYDLELASLEQRTLERLSEILPLYWSHGNPIDLLGDATPKRYADVVGCCFTATEVDGMLVILNPQAMTDPTDMAVALAEHLKGKPYPVVTSVMGGVDAEKARGVLNKAGIPTYETPERAVRAFYYLHEYARNLEMLQEIPPNLQSGLEPDHDKARKLINQGINKRGGLLTEVESKELLSCFGITVNPTKTARSLEDAIDLATEMGFPVVMKILSRDISHKTEANGVQVDLRNETDIREGYRKIMEGVRAHNPDAEVLGVTLQPMILNPDYEILIGAKEDRDFGPVLLFAMGGIFAEALGDRAIGLPPINRSLARMLMERTKLFTLLRGYRNRPPANLPLLEEILVGLSHLVADFPEILEVDMNPVMVKDGNTCVVDVRFILERSDVRPPLHLSISPYPEHYEWRETTSGGLQVLIRSIKPEDAPLLMELFHAMSRESIYHRFFSPLKSLPLSMLVKFTQIDYDREIALVALGEEGGKDKLLGVARAISDPDRKDAEFALAVGDPWHRKGLGTKLLQKCIQVARDYGIKTLQGRVLSDNRGMLALAEKLGFHVSRSMEADEYLVSMDLTFPVIPDERCRSSRDPESRKTT
jgi:acetyltransferase